MNLAMNTYVYEVAKAPIEKTLQSAADFGFKYVEYVACDAGDPTLMSISKRKEVIKRFKDSGFYCAQMLLANTEHTASSNAKLRETTLDYMKACSEFMLELGGKQALICWGNGVYEKDVPPEQTWLHAVDTTRRFAEWGLDKGVLVDFEMEPHVYFVSNSSIKAAQLVEDVGMPNVFPNMDIGHLAILRESPHRLDKLGKWFLQVHLSETDTYEHTNSIIGTGKVDFKAYVDKAIELGIEENCKRFDEPCVAGIEMGEPGGYVDDPDRWMRESLDYLKKIMPELTM